MVTDLAPRSPPLLSVKVGTNENYYYYLYLPIISEIIGAANRKIFKKEKCRTVCSTTPTRLKVAYSIS
jgi:hypothetical protein